MLSVMGTDTLSIARDLHTQLVDACRRLTSEEHRASKLLARVVDAGHLRTLGYSNITQYADTALHLNPGKAYDLLRIGRSLGDLPRLDATFAAGDMEWTKAREIVRVATPETEAAWIERASHVSNRRLEREVARSLTGDLPPKREEREPARKRVTFEMEAGDKTLLQDCLAYLRSQSGLKPGEVDDGALLAEMARRILHDAQGKEAPSGEPYRVVLERCPDCKDTHSVDADASETVVNEACCDAEVVDAESGSTTRTIPPKLRMQVLVREKFSCGVPGCTNRLWLDIHHLEGWAFVRRHRLDELLAVCGLHHRAIHEGTIAVVKTRDGAIRVRFADGRELVGPVRFSRGESPTA
jgi:hypothetical protein